MKWWAVPIREFLHDSNAFKPEDVSAMGEAFDAALIRLGLRGEERMAETVARRIIRAALAGKRDVQTLTEIGVGGH
jgi:hypothetical protein